MFKSLAVVATCGLCFCATLSAETAMDSRLFSAIERFDTNGVREALAEGANPNAVVHSLTPLAVLMQYISVAWGRGDDSALDNIADITEVLFSKGGRLSSLDDEYFFFPIAYGQVEIVTLLLEHGASPTKKLQGYSPTELAIQHKHKDIYDLLVSAGAPPIDSTQVAQVALVEAASRFDIGGMTNALSEGGKINEPDGSGQTALITCLRWFPFYTSDQVNAVLWLLDNGADPNKKGDSGYQGVAGIPLHIAVSLLSTTLSSVARTAKADLVEANGLRVVEGLLDHGARVSSLDDQLITPLHLAAKGDAVGVARLLIKAGARVRARDFSNRTPLDYAQSKEMIQLLEHSGAVEQ